MIEPGVGRRFGERPTGNLDAPAEAIIDAAAVSWYTPFGQPGRGLGDLVGEGVGDELFDARHVPVEGVASHAGRSAHVRDGDLRQPLVRRAFERRGAETLARAASSGVHLAMVRPLSDATAFARDDEAS